jgi:hypothetical protein
MLSQQTVANRSAAGGTNHGAKPACVLVNTLESGPDSDSAAPHFPNPRLYHLASAAVHGPPRTMLKMHTGKTHYPSQYAPEQYRFDMNGAEAFNSSI